VTDERWPHVKALFQAAVERPAEECAAFPTAATGEDEALRHEVEALLASDASGGSFLDRLPVASASVLADPLAAPGASGNPTPSPATLATGRRVGPQRGRRHARGGRHGRGLPRARHETASRRRPEGAARACGMHKLELTHAARSYSRTSPPSRSRCTTC